MQTNIGTLRLSPQTFSLTSEAPGCCLRSWPLYSLGSVFQVQKGRGGHNHASTPSPGGKATPQTRGLSAVTRALFRFSLIGLSFRRSTVGGRRQPHPVAPLCLCVCLRTDSQAPACSELLLRQAAGGLGGLLGREARILRLGSVVITARYRGSCTSPLSSRCTAQARNNKNGKRAGVRVMGGGGRRCSIFSQTYVLKLVFAI